MKLFLFFFWFLPVDLGMTRTTPLPDRQALDMILDKLQKCVLYILCTVMRSFFFMI